MNNILTFEDYRKMSIRQVESVIYRQFIEEDIKDEVNEGFIRNAINKAASKFIQNALADEIEKGKELEKNIKAALDGLDKGFEEIKKKIDTKANSKSKLALFDCLLNITILFFVGHILMKKYIIHKFIYQEYAISFDKKVKTAISIIKN